MGDRLSVSTALQGVASVVAGALMVDGGVREVIGFWPLGQLVPITLGALGALASGVLLWSGLALWMRDPRARTIARRGALAMIPVHLVGFATGFVGIPGLLLGVVYPLLVLASGRRNRKAIVQPLGDSTSAPNRYGDHTHQMSASLA
jgi:hypothetical protein